MTAKKNNPYKHILTQLITDALQNSKNKPLNYKQIAAKLNVLDEESKKAIQGVLIEEAKSGNLKEISKGKYVLKELKTIIVGRVDLTADGSAYIVPEDELEDDIYVAPRKLRNALHGDTVKVHAYESRRGRKKEGEVLEIITRARDTYTGLIKVSPRFAFLVADDRKMLHDIFIPLEDLNGAVDGQKAVVVITEWPEGSKNPIGRVKDILGFQGENNTEMNAILADYGFPLSFPDEVEKESEALSDVIPKTEIAKRRDFRNTLTFTIDPA